MAWRNRNRKRRQGELSEKWGQRLRTAWSHLSPQERIDFLAEEEEKRHAARGGASVLLAYEDEAVGVDWPAWPPPEPENPAYNAAVQHYGGDPLTRAALTHTQLIPIYPGGE